MAQLDKHKEYKDSIYNIYNFDIDTFQRVLFGGKAEKENKGILDFDLNQIIKGIKVEFEHTDSVNVAIAIVMDHLSEFDNYYDALAKTELSLSQNPQRGKIKVSGDYKQYQERIKQEFQFDIKNFNPALKDGIFETHHRRITDFSIEQIVKGIRVELEHSNQINDALDIALDHLDKFYNYYDGLEKMEKVLEKSLVSEIPSKCRNQNDKILTCGDNDAISFAYWNGMFYSMPLWHADIAATIASASNQTTYNIYKNFKFAGRIWLRSKVMSFYEYPDSMKTLISIFSNLRNSDAVKSTGIPMGDIQNWKIEDWQGKDYLEADIIPITKFDNFSKRKRKKEPKRSFDNFGSQLQQTKASKSGFDTVAQWKSIKSPYYEQKVSESPDTVWLSPNKKLRYNALDAVSFGFYRGQLYVDDKIHTAMAMTLSRSFNVDAHVIYEQMTHKGRIWLQEKIVSFYDYVQNKQQLMSIMTQLKEHALIKQAGIEFGDLNMWWLDDWKGKQDFEPDENSIFQSTLVPLLAYEPQKGTPETAKPQKQVQSQIPDFGAKLQGKMAKQAGFDTVAQWNASRMQEKVIKEGAGGLYIKTDGNSEPLTCYDSDAVAFGLDPVTLELVAEEDTTHDRLKISGWQNFNREIPPCLGRLWQDNEVISFWYKPTTEAFMAFVPQMNKWLTNNNTDTVDIRKYRYNWWWVTEDGKSDDNLLISYDEFVKRIQKIDTVSWLFDKGKFKHYLIPGELLSYPKNQYIYWYAEMIARCLLKGIITIEDLYKNVPKVIQSVNNLTSHYYNTEQKYSYLLKGGYIIGSVSELTGNNKYSLDGWEKALITMQQYFEPYLKVIEKQQAPHELSPLLKLGANTNPNFGSRLQNRMAKDAGFDIPAQWNASRMQENVIKENYSVTANPNFMNWFNGSKVVDENGNPLKVYHGTSKHFSEFKPSLSGIIDNGLTIERVPRYGYFFTTSTHIANSYAAQPYIDFYTEPEHLVNYESNIMPLYLSIKNPKDLRHGVLSWSTDEYKQMIKYGCNNKKIRFYSICEAWELFDGTDGEIFINALIKLGYDGAIIKESAWEYDDPQFVAFYPNQIKSAIGNKGTYSISSNRMDEQIIKENPDNAMDATGKSHNWTYGFTFGYDDNKQMQVAAELSHRQMHLWRDKTICGRIWLLDNHKVLISVWNTLPKDVFAKVIKDVSDAMIQKYPLVLGRWGKQEFLSIDNWQIDYWQAQKVIGVEEMPDIKNPTTLAELFLQDGSYILSELKIAQQSEVDFITSIYVQALQIIANKDVKMFEGIVNSPGSTQLLSGFNAYVTQLMQKNAVMSPNAFWVTPSNRINAQRWLALTSAMIRWNENNRINAQNIEKQKQIQHQVPPIQKTNKPINTGFGADLQAKQAKQAGFDTVAQWNASRMQENVVKESSVAYGDNPLTKNPNFQKWFSGSKVVDMQGNPKMVYHGTDEDFNFFRPTTDWNVGNTAGGMFFTDSPSEAFDYALGQYMSGVYDKESGPNIKPVYLSIKNPLIINARGRGGNGGIIEKAFEKAYALGKDGIIIRNVKDSPDYTFSVFRKRNYEEHEWEGNIEEYTQPARIQTLYIVFRPYQIKSVFNPGGWNSQSYRIDESKSSLTELFIRNLYSDILKEIRTAIGNPKESFSNVFLPINSANMVINFTDGSNIDEIRTKSHNLIMSLFSIYKQHGIRLSYKEKSPECILLKWNKVNMKILTQPLYRQNGISIRIIFNGIAK